MAIYGGCHVPECICNLSHKSVMYTLYTLLKSDISFK